MKLTEDEVVLSLKQYLESKGWFIGTNFRLGHKHGYDIKATKDEATLIVEAKGAKANDNDYNKTRDQFDSGQIKTHFGKALVKVLEEKCKNPSFQFAIAHPDDEYIRRCIGQLVPFLKALQIKHFWVEKSGIIKED